MNWIVGIVLVLFGVASVHYEIGEGWVHHAEWAVQHGMPRPSFGIFVLGVLCTIAGSGLVGWLIGRRARPSA